jgi:hypothetical protein
MLGVSACTCDLHDGKASRGFRAKYVQSIGINFCALMVETGNSMAKYVRFIGIGVVNSSGWLKFGTSGGT